METCDLVLVNPAAAHGIKGGHPIYGDLGFDLIAIEPPLWVRLIAGYVRDRGHSIQIIDAEAERLTPEETSQRIEEANPLLVAIITFGHQPSASTQQMFGAREVATAIKNANPERKIIIAGGHVSALPERTLQEEPVDWAVNGEGPRTIVGLLYAIKETRVMPTDLSFIPGLIWRNGTAIASNPTAPLITDLDKDLHGDVWDLLPMHLFRAHNWQCFGELENRQPYASIYTSLGCPYKCEFCCINAPFGTNRYRMRSPQAVVAEIKMLYERYGIRTIKITDELFILNERHYRAICEGIIAEGLGDKLNIWCYARPDTVKTETLSLLRRAGIRWLALGIESGSETVLEGANKSMPIAETVAIVREIQKAGISVIGNYIFGLRDDNEQTMRETMKLAQECNTEFANFYSTMAYPGSQLYKEAVANGWTLPDSWRGYSQHNDDCRPLDTAHVSGATVLKFRDEAFDRYFTNPRYLDMVTQKFGWETRKHIEQMTTYKLKRKLLEDAAV